MGDIRKECDACGERADYRFQLMDVCGEGETPEMRDYGYLCEKDLKSCCARKEFGCSARDCIIDLGTGGVYKNIGSALRRADPDYYMHLKDLEFGILNHEDEEIF